MGFWTRWIRGWRLGWGYRLLIMRGLGRWSLGCLGCDIRRWLGAINVRGIVSDVPLSLNGTAAKLIKVIANKANAGPLLVIVSLRDGMVYKLGAFGKRLEDVEEAFNEVRNGWQWEPFRSATE